jgi:outer membrane lipoprotein SlyB
MKFRTIHLVAAVIAAATLAACGAGDGTPPAPDARAAPTARAAAPAVRADVGTITAVVALREAEPTTGAGAVLGGVLGAAVGNQVGKGDGRKAATVIGAVGGAAVGHNVEKQRNTRIVGYRVDVRLDNGNATSVTMASAGGLANGQRVRVVNGALQPA